MLCEDYIYLCFDWDFTMRPVLCNACVHCTEYSLGLCECKSCLILQITGKANLMIY